jgi:hypothetical protein
MMNANERNATIERRLQEQLLVGRRLEGDRLVLDDATLLAALDGSRPLRGAERDAMQASPLTLRRLRQLAQERRAGARSDTGIDANSAWRGSRGMLRAASSQAALAPLSTDDGCWTLHFVEADGAWRAILQLAPQAPFAAGLLAARAPLHVRDGSGQRILSGRIDADGECEAAWPFAAAPAAHLQAHGAAFTVTPD